MLFFSHIHFWAYNFCILSFFSLSFVGWDFLLLFFLFFSGFLIHLGGQTNVYFLYLQKFPWNLFIHSSSEFTNAISAHITIDCTCTFNFIAEKDDLIYRAHLFALVLVKCVFVMWKIHHYQCALLLIANTHNRNWQLHMNKNSFASRIFFWMVNHSNTLADDCCNNTWRRQRVRKIASHVCSMHCIQIRHTYSTFEMHTHTEHSWHL